MDNFLKKILKDLGMGGAVEFKPEHLCDPNKITAREARPNMSATELYRYRESARKFGFRPGALVQEELVIFFANVNVPVFDTRETVDYLNRQNRRDWEWVPLRQKDAEKKLELSDRNCRYGGKINNGRVCQRMIPSCVLASVKEIGALFPEVGFFLSNGKGPNPEHFLMLTGTGLRAWVVAHWNRSEFA